MLQMVEMDDSDAKTKRRRRRGRNAVRCRRYRLRKKVKGHVEKRVAKKGLLFREYDALIAVIVHHRRRLGLSQLAMDQISGLPDGYQGKIEAKIKSLGPKSLPLVLQTLGLKMAIVQDGEPHVSARRAGVPSRSRASQLPEPR